MMTLETILVDEDGNDAAQVLAVLLARPEMVRVLGVTSVFGNAGVGRALKNMGDILYFLGAGHVPYFRGCAGPTGCAPLEGDGAHGGDGIGDVNLATTTVAPQTMSAVDFILESLRTEPEGTVTLIAAAPLTNMAQAFQRDPETMARVKRILIMGGCTEKMPAADRALRQGNITPQAEFNFYMAAADARTVLDSGLPIVLFPMNVTHQMTLTPEREARVREALASRSAAAEAVVGMMKAPAALDLAKFASFSVMHDVHTALYVLHPEKYEGRRGFVDVVTNGGEALGRSDFRVSDDGNVCVMEKAKDTDALFACVLEGLTRCLLSPASSA